MITDEVKEWYDGYRLGKLTFIVLGTQLDDLIDDPNSKAEKSPDVKHQ